MRRRQVLAALLREQGFRKVNDLDAGTLQARYLAGRGDGFTVTGSSRLMIASV